MPVVIVMDFSSLSANRLRVTKYTAIVSIIRACNVECARVVIHGLTLHKKQRTEEATGRRTSRLLGILNAALHAAAELGGIALQTMHSRLLGTLNAPPKHSTLHSSTRGNEASYHSSMTSTLTVAPCEGCGHVQGSLSSELPSPSSPLQAEAAEASTASPEVN